MQMEKKIQYLCPDGWEDCIPSWSENSDYRIKPENKLVPFTISDTVSLMGKVVVLKSEKNAFYGMIVACTNNCVMVARDFILFETLFNEWNFIDGSPCGKHVD